MSRFIISAFADEISQDLKTQMDVLQEHDISYIEMRGVNGKTITEYSLQEAREIKKQLDDRGFKLSAVGSPIGKIGITEDFLPHKDYFKHTLELASLLESKYIRMFSFYIPRGEAPDKYRDEVMERWFAFAELAKGSGITLLHENEKGIYGEDAEHCLDLMKTLNCDYVKAIFDPANFVQSNVETFPHAYELLKDYIVYMHIKDAVYSDHHVEPAGYGDGRLKDILSALYDRGFDGYLSLEPHLWNFAGFEKLELEPTWNKYEGNGPKLFSVAAGALKKLVDEITQK
jgi:sugar phosphate isomerase/epimerase